MAISESVDGVDSQDDLREVIRDVVHEETADLREENRQLRQENEHLRDRVDELEDQATVEMRGDKKYGNIFIDDLPFGVRFDSLRDEVEELIDRVIAIERDEVDVSDILDVNGSENQLPIQRDTSSRKNNTHDFDGNKYRATFVWPEFHERAQASSGNLILHSWQVKNILDENDLDTNPNTVRRVMQFVAKLTKRVDGQNEDDVTFDPKDEDNLVKFNDDGAQNTLVADKDEWQEFFDEQTQAVLGGSDEEQDVEDETTTDDATDNVDEDVDGLMAASAVTTSSEDDVEDEAGIEVTR